eukprot:5341745-Pyramimonas_sp.AAC.1
MRYQTPCRLRAATLSHGIWGRGALVRFLFFAAAAIFGVTSKRDSLFAAPWPALPASLAKG